jgi:hypothetical protein
MATAATIIARAMRLLGELESGGTPEVEEYADGLVALNAMLDTWRNEGLMCFARQEESLTLSASDASYTIGPGGDLVTTRPVLIEKAWISQGGVDYPVAIIEDDEYASIPMKATAADWPEKANYKATMPAGTLYVYPVPNATRTLKLLTQVPVTAFASTATTVSLPPGWEQAMAANLAVEWAPEFETEASQTVREMARKSKAGIKAVNHRPLKGDSGLVTVLRAKSNILAGP